MFQPDYDFDQDYTEDCENCGKSVTVVTQRDERPEYYTEVAVRCECGHFAVFSLPVN